MTRGKYNANPSKNIPTAGRRSSNYNNSARSDASPSGASGGTNCTTPPPPLGNVTSSLCTTSSVIGQIAQLKRSKTPSTENKWQGEVWANKLYKILDDQAQLIDKLQMEHQQAVDKLHSEHRQAVDKLHSEHQQAVVDLKAIISSQREDILIIKDSMEERKLQFEHLQNENNVTKEVLGKIRKEETPPVSDIARLENIIHTLQAQQTTSLDDSEQQKLQDSIIFSSPELPEEQQGENVSKIAQELIKTKLSVSINIKSAVRIGRNSSVKRVLIKLSDPSAKSGLMHAAATQKKGIYVNECLTKPRQSLFYRLRQIRKNNPGLLHQCFTRDGTILCRKTSVGKLYQITTDLQLESFLIDCGITVNESQQSSSVQAVLTS